MLEAIGKQIRERRKELGMTQVALSKKSKVSRLIIIRLEKGEIENCCVSTLSAIAEALGTTVDIFMP